MTDKNTMRMLLVGHLLIIFAGVNSILKFADRNTMADMSNILIANKTNLINIGASAFCPSESDFKPKQLAVHI